ncbi:hypothetical protein, partial [Pseudomonas sp. AH2 (2023)]|uniref:hypothetical protein n=1 Tax=Pseudomonas sp. AH2 (2023) TaxID=3048599 RepID=UPI002B232E02
VYFICAILVMMALAIASFYWVEEPIRRSNLFVRRGKRDRDRFFNGFNAPQFAALAVAVLVSVPLGVAAFERTRPVERDYVAA